MREFFFGGSNVHANDSNSSSSEPSAFASDHDGQMISSQEDGSRLAPDGGRFWNPEHFRPVEHN